jgi:hypothetical protein
MQCTCGNYVSGDYCKRCEKLLVEPKAKTKAIKKRSDSGKRDDLIYKALRLKFLRENPRCSVYPELKASEVHHKKGRVGKNYLDVSTWLAVSRKAHQEIEENPDWAKSKGYSLSRLENGI